MLKRLFVCFFLASAFLCGCASPVSSVEATTDTTVKSTTSPAPFSLEDAVFLGDSNIAHLSSYGLLPEEQIWTGSQRYLTLEPDVCRKYIVYPETGTEMTVCDAVSLKKPKFLVITLGTDGALGLDREGVRLSYVSLIESIRNASSDTKILIQSIFPIRPAILNGRFDSVDAVNQKFDLVNLWLAEIADEYGIVYLDTRSVLTDKHGMLREEYNTDHLDGYHLNRAGLEAVLEYILENAK